MAWFVLLPTAFVLVEGPWNKMLLEPAEIFDEPAAVDLQRSAGSVTRDRGVVNVSMPTLRRFKRCSTRHRERILGRMRGYELGWQIRPPWNQESFMTMLLDSDERRYSQAWINTFVADVLPLSVYQIPQVATWVKEWLRTHTDHSKPMRVNVVRTDLLLTLRYEEWILHRPGLREECVLAYRAQPTGCCPCCQQPATWKLPRGPRGCAAHVMKLVANKQFQPQWMGFLKCLSRSTASRFEEVLKLECVGAAVLEALVCHVHSLSCSCGGCVRGRTDGNMCPVEIDYIKRERAGPDSPRSPFEPLLPEPLPLGGLPHETPDCWRCLAYLGPRGLHALG